MKNGILTLSTLIAFFTCIILFTSCSTEHKPISSFKSFDIVIERTSEAVDVSMKCTKGCAWKTLTFSTEQPQAVNEYGMTDIESDKKSLKQDDDLADLLFVVLVTQDGVKLKGLKGTGWDELEFPLTKGENQSIDENGMVSF